MDLYLLGLVFKPSNFRLSYGGFLDDFLLFAHSSRSSCLDVYLVFLRLLLLYNEKLAEASSAL
jgi:hypothetical protein